MDLRAVVLIAGVIGPGVTPAGASTAPTLEPIAGDSLAAESLAGATPAADSLDPDGNPHDGTGDRVTGDALQDEAEFVVDVETLALVDALLVDPVDLGRQDIDRLGVLPWLDDEALAALARAAPPPADVAELARLPGWSASLARRVAPFVRFATARAPSAPRVMVTGSSSLLRSRIESRHARLALRFAPGVEPGLRGFADAHRERSAVAVGDLRYGHAQGLLAWTGEASARAGAPIGRHARGLVGSESVSRLRTLRGAGLELVSGGTRLATIVGRAEGARTWLAACSRRLTPTSTIACALLQEGPRTWWSVGAALGPESRRLACEIAGRHRPAFAASGEARSGRLRLGVRFDAIPPAALPSLGGATTSVRQRGARTARIAATYTAKALAIDVGLAGERRAEGEGRVRWRTETMLGARARRDRSGIEVRLDERMTETDSWLDDSESQLVRDATRVLVLRFDRRLAIGWTWTAEVRAALEALPAPARSGRGFALRFERRRGTLQPVVAGGSFRTDPGVSVGTLATAAGLGPVQLHGDGFHFTLGLRCTARHWTGVGGMLVRWSTDRPLATTLRGTLGVRFP